MTGTLHLTIKFQKNLTVIMVIVKLDFFYWRLEYKEKENTDSISNKAIYMVYCHTNYTTANNKLLKLSVSYYLSFTNDFGIFITYLGIHIVRYIWQLRNIIQPIIFYLCRASSLESIFNSLMLEYCVFIDIVYGKDYANRWKCYIWMQWFYNWS